MTPLLELNERVVQDVLLTNGELLRKFPFIIPVKTKWDSLKTCPSCQRAAKGNAYRASVQELIAQISQMSNEDKATFKSILGTKYIRVYLPVMKDGKRSMRRVDF